MNKNFTVLEISDIQKVEDQEQQTKIETKSSPQQETMNLCEQTMSEIMDQQTFNLQLSVQRLLINLNIEHIQPFQLQLNKFDIKIFNQTPKIKNSENTEDHSLSKSQNKQLHEKIYIKQASYENGKKIKNLQKKVLSQKTKNLQKQEQLQEQTSIDSRYMSKIEKLKRKFIPKLEMSQCKKRISYVKLALLLSVFGIICIWALTIAYYFLARTLFINQRDKLIHVSLPMSLRSISSNQIYYSQYIRFVDYDIFLGMKQDKSLQDFILANIQRIKDDKSYNRVQTNQTSSYFYFLSLYFKIVHRYTTQLYDVLNEEAFDVNNFLHFNIILTELQDIIEQEAQQNMIYITQNYQQISYIVIAISLMILVQLLTITYCITLNNQSNLKLITTFSPEALTEIRKELDRFKKF
ncbi:hypothetical protein ABPG72_005589 [Tetrahymena utriculariae]